MSQSTVNSGQYASGAASLFATTARGEPSTPAPAPAKRRLVVIPCPWCLSDDTDLIDHEHDIFKCRNCGETFIRSSG